MTTLSPTTWILRLRRRRQLLRIVDGLGLAWSLAFLATGTILWCLPPGLLREWTVRWWWLAFALSGAAAGVMTILVRLPSLPREIDRRRGWEDRLTTAFEYEARQETTRWAPLLARDVEQHLRTASVSPILGVARTCGRWNLIILAMGLAGFLPRLETSEENRGLAPDPEMAAVLFGAGVSGLTANPEESGSGGESGKGESPSPESGKETPPVQIPAGGNKPGEPEKQELQKAPYDFGADAHRVPEFILPLKTEGPEREKEVFVYDLASGAARSEAAEPPKVSLPEAQERFRAAAEEFMARAKLSARDRDLVRRYFHRILPKEDK